MYHTVSYQNPKVMMKSSSIPYPKCVKKNYNSLPCYHKSYVKEIKIFKELINLNKNKHIMTNLPFGLLGSKSRVLHLERTPSPVPSIQMYSSMTFVSRGRVMYRSRTFLSVAAVCNDILETWILRNNNIMTLLASKINELSIPPTLWWPLPLAQQIIGILWVSSLSSTWPACR